MKSVLLVLIMTVLGPHLVLGQAPAKKDQSGSAEEEIMRIRRDWYNAFFRGDTATMNRIETDDFIVVSESGLENKRSQLAGIQRAVKENRWKSSGVTLVDEDMKLRFHGETAVLSERSWNKESGQGNKSPESKAAVTEVWIKHDGRWQVMHLHYNALDQPASTRR